MSEGPPGPHYEWHPLPTEPPPAPYINPPTAKKGLRWGLIVIPILVIALGAAAFVYFTKDDGPHYPDQWDPRVLDLVRYVELHRKLTFEHPIDVEFLSDAEFKKEVTSDEGTLTDEDKKEIADAEALFRALGLIEGDVSLFEEENALQGGGVIGLYSFEDKNIKVRGSKLSPYAKVTLVHELTHALQDQTFDLEKRFDDFDKAENDSASTAYRAIVEGDADRIEEKYRKTLSKADKKAYDAEDKRVGKQYDKDTKEVPKVLTALFSSPYVLGSGFLELATQVRGESEIDGVFRIPPNSDEHLLDPWTYLDNDNPKTVGAPLLSGETKLDEGVFGALGLYFLLAERIPLADALRATDGWAGDGYVTYESGGDKCVRIVFEGDEDHDVDEMAKALRQWAAKAPKAAKAVAERQGDSARLESCDPGKKNAGKVTGASEDALILVATRTAIAVDAMKNGGANKSQAKCFAHKVVLAFPSKALINGQLSLAQQQQIGQIANSCR